MSAARPALPDFANPPVIEVALSVQFNPLTGLRLSHMGVLWTKLGRERFPKTEDHAPIAPAIERFGLPEPPEVSVRLETTHPVPRCWFLNDAGTELIQVQQDRFVHNWRKVGEGEKYPRYEHVREAFIKELSTFQAFLAEESLGKLIPNQCEVTYVNHIFAGTAWERYGQLEEIVTVWGSRYSDSFLSELEEARFAVSYVIPDADGEPLGRLHISVEPRYRIMDAKRLYRMTLTARGRPLREGSDGILGFFDKGREWIVRGFTSITTQRMHEIWGRQDEH